MGFWDAVHAEVPSALQLERERVAQELELEARFQRRVARGERLRLVADVAAAVSVERWYFDACGFRS